MKHTPVQNKGGAGGKPIAFEEGGVGVMGGGGRGESRGRGEESELYRFSTGFQLQMGNILTSRGHLLFISSPVLAPAKLIFSFFYILLASCGRSKQAVTLSNKQAKQKGCNLWAAN